GLGRVGDGRDLGNVRMHPDDPLDLEAGYVLAAPSDALLLAAGEIEIARGIAAHIVATVEPEFLCRAQRLYRLVEITIHNDRRQPEPAYKFADLARRHRQAVVVDDLDLPVLVRLAARVGPPLRPVRVDG